MTYPKLMKTRLDAVRAQQVAATFAQTAELLGLPFDAAAFLAHATADLDTLELMDRVRLWATAFDRALPQNFDHALRLCEAALAPPCDPLAPKALDHVGDRVGGMAILAVTRWVPLRLPDDPARGLDALGRLTGRYTAEFDVRPYLKDHPAPTWAALTHFAQSADAHQRRLASEGSRPRLPWGLRVPALLADPEPGLALIEQLKDDESPYVRRSVANHLNDVGRDHPERALQCAAQWLQDAGEARRALVRHGLRGLARRGHPRALTLLGYGASPDLRVLSLSAAEPSQGRAQVGEKFFFCAEIENLAAAPIAARFDYQLHSRAQPQRRARVYHISTRQLAPGRHTLRSHHAFRVVSGRRPAAGPYRLSLRVNGQALAQLDFECFDSQEVPP